MLRPQHVASRLTHTPSAAGIIGPGAHLWLAWGVWCCVARALTGVYHMRYLTLSVLHGCQLPSCTPFLQGSLGSWQ